MVVMLNDGEEIPRLDRVVRQVLLMVNREKGRIS